MLYLNVLEDEILCDSLDNLISGMLPHEHYQPELYREILRKILKYIKEDELSGEYHVLVSILSQVASIGASIKNYSPRVTRQSVETILNANIVDLVRKPEVNIKYILKMEGQATNLDIEVNLNSACITLTSHVLALYDRCFSKAVESSSALSFVMALEGAFISHIAEKSMHIQSEILNSSVRIGKAIYSGSHDWLQYVSFMQAELKTRLRNDDDVVFRVDNISKGTALIEGVRNLFYPLAKYGLPPMDEETPILKHRLVVIAANENTGKTMFALHSACNLLREGKSILFMSGETSKNLVYAKILSNLIYSEYQIYITPYLISHPEELPEEKLKILNLMNAKIAEQDLIRIVPSLSYDTLYDELVAAYAVKPFDALLIDHSTTLKGSSNLYENVGMLANNLRNFKLDYPVYVQVLSQLSVIAKEAIAKGKDVENSPTKGNASLSQEADDIFILFDNEVLRKQDLIAIQNYKRRDAPKILELMILRKKFNVCCFEWDDRIQNGAEELNISAEKAIKNIETLESTEDEFENEDYLDDLDD